MKKFYSLLITLIVALMILPGCSSGAPANSSTNAPYSNQSVVPSTDNKAAIAIKGFAFSPKELSINKGDTVTWTNEDSAVHNVVGGILKSKDLAKGESFSYTFADVGTYDYICTYHPSMKGKIIVK
jgi:plastocyanin